jgi:hypothetical protein
MGMQKQRLQKVQHDLDRLAISEKVRLPLIASICTLELSSL